MPAKPAHGDLSTGEPIAARRPGRPRSQRVRRAILDAALELLDEVGFVELTVEGISARAGVGKATIYRWWPNKARLVMDAFLAEINPQTPFPNTGSARADTRRQMRLVVKVFRSARGRALAAVIGALQTEPELAEAFRSRWLAERRATAKRVLRRGVDRGQIRRDADLEVAIDALYGPLYYRLLVDSPLTQEYADSLADLVMTGLAV